jgi:hypothetical protein
MQSGIASLAASYAARGWKLVRLYGVVRPAVCTCSKGADCATPGKHPAGGNGWHLSATSDEEEILSWFDSGRPVNIGLLLGPRSGVIDVELDGDDAKQAWLDLGLGEIWTPTYTAGRGPHRLFRWAEDLPAVAVKKVLGIEVRIGNDGRAAQSVLPPSVHHTGVTYQWVEGMSPDEVELQPLPEKLVNLLFNDDGTGRRSPARSPARAVLSRPVPEGERNNDLYRFAVAEAFRAGPNLDDAREQQDLLLKVRAVNSLQCRPPMDDSEVVALYRSAIGYARKTRAAGVDSEVAIQQAEASGPPPAVSATQGAKQAAVRGEWKTFTETGLSFAPADPDSDPEWGPGEWHLTVVHSDPLEYRLHVPAWIPLTAQGTGNISLTVDQYVSAPKVARAVLAATGTVMLDAEPGKWRRIWDGGYRVEDGKSQQNPKKRVALGLKAKLLANVSHEWPGASSLRYVLLATWLYDRLSQASQPADDDVPDPTGRACWRQDGTLWFAWGKVWEDIERQHRVQDGERLALKRRLLAHLPGEKDFGHAEYRHLGGARKSYVVWSRREFAILESLATPGGERETLPTI